MTGELARGRGNGDDRARRARGRESRGAGWRAAALALVLVGAPAALPHAYLDGPPAAHTGGFGEPTCRACHFGSPLNEPAGELSVDGLPPRLSPSGSVLDLVVRLARPGLRRGGFQLSARWAAGPAAGEQAGRFRLPDGRTRADSASGVVYVHHSEPGSRAASTDSLRWRIRWRPPRKPEHPVVVHVSANAANDDASEFGDHVYADSVVLAPSDGSGRP